MVYVCKKVSHRWHTFHHHPAWSFWFLSFVLLYRLIRVCPHRTVPCKAWKKSMRSFCKIIHIQILCAPSISLWLTKSSILLPSLLSAPSSSSSLSTSDVVVGTVKTLRVVAAALAAATKGRLVVNAERCSICRAQKKNATKNMYNMIKGGSVNQTILSRGKYIVLHK